MSCEYRDLYIRIFELFVQLGGDVDQLKKFSPIEKVTSFFLMKDFGRCSNDTEDINININGHSKIANKTMKRLKDFEKVGNSLLKIKQCFKISPDDHDLLQLKTSSKALLRRCLDGKLNLISEIVHREKMRLELIKLI